MVNPSMTNSEFRDFTRLARSATLVPVVKSVSADLLTPVSAFLSIAENEPHAFLLESVERGEQIGRYTFLGARPYMRLRARGATIEIERGRRRERRQGNVFQVVKELLGEHQPAEVPGLPPFTAGAVGYFSYDVVRQLEKIGEHAKNDLSLPDCELMFFDRLLAFDHLRHQIHIVAAADVTRENPRRAYDRAVRDIAALERKLAAGLRPAMSRKSAKGKPGETQDSRRNYTCGVSAQCGVLQGIHRGGRHLSGSAFAEARFHSRGCTVRSLPRAAPGQSFSLSLFSADGGVADPRLLARDASARNRAKAGISAHRGHPSARAGRGRRPAPGSSRCAATKRSAPSTSCWSIWDATIWGG